MPTFRTAIVCLVFALAMHLTGAALCGAQQPGVQDYGRITQVPRAELDAWLKQEAAASGGDWDQGRYHLYIGFSTGHFGQDPVHAIAMRRIAFSLMNNSLAAGDRVTPIAWEMQTWDLGPAVTLTDDPASRAEFVNRVPYTPRSGSHGGHDIERVLYETVTKAIPADEAGSAIVILLTNSNASQAPTGERASLFGENNPKLAEALAAGHFRTPIVRKEFRLMAGAQPVTVGVAALFPERLVSLPGAAAAPRYPTFSRESWQPSADRPASGEALPNPVKPAAAVPQPAAPVAPARGGISPLVWALVAVAVVVGLLWAYRSSTSYRTYSADQSTKQPQPTAAPMGRPIPGSLTVLIGAAEQTLQPLTASSKWLLQRDETGAVTLADAAPDVAAPSGGPSAGTAIARLEFAENRDLRVSADSGAQFTDLNGPDPARLDSRTLTIAPGTKTFCRIVPAGSTSKTRLEVVYNTTSKIASKGSRA
ncbi:MAG TPA: hypothetical protein VKT77_19605 [Chthonomonadaceae bacterium]|nr:hypothetical protein [Chthonomonadaceae bacterium]